MSISWRMTRSKGAKRVRAAASAAGNFLMQYLQKRNVKPAGDGGTWFQAFNGSSRNVLAWIEGSDPVLKNELILLGAHYDHVGYGNANNSYGPFGRIHNGADDNASGVAGLLEIMDAVQNLSEPPKRSMLFAFWDSEERGLDGSKAWVAPTQLAWQESAPGDQPRYDRAAAQSTCRSLWHAHWSWPRELVSRSNRDDLDLDFLWTMQEDSDHYTFYKAGIPTLMLHTGLHENYHRPSDDAHTLNLDGMKRMTRCILAVAINAAERPTCPASGEHR